MTLVASTLASALTVGIGAGLAYVAGQAAADSMRPPAAPPIALRRAEPSVPLAKPILAVLVVSPSRATRDDSEALARFLRPASWRQIPVSSAARPYQTAGSDINCLTAAVYYEARSESDAGQAAVAQVVLNRVRNPVFPKTVCGVVYQGVSARACQFTFACDGSTRRPVERAAWDRARAVAGRALAGYVMPTVGRAVSYHTIALGDLWAGAMVEVARIGQHVFYGLGRPASDPAPDVGAPVRPVAPIEPPPAVAASVPAVTAAAQQPVAGVTPSAAPAA